MHKENNLYVSFTLLIILLYISFFYFIGCHKDINGPENNPSIAGHTPNLISPENKIYISVEHLTFMWNSIMGATMYRLQISRDSSFQTLILDNLLNKDTSFIYQNSISFGEYYWRVWGITKIGNIWGPSSEIWNFVMVSSLLERLHKMELYQITIHAIHMEKNEKDSVRLQNVYQYPNEDLGPLLPFVKWQGQLLHSDENFIIGHSFKGSETTDAQLSSDGKVLEKLTFNAWGFRPTTYDITISGEVKNLPLVENPDTSAFYFRVDGINSKEHLKQIDYNFIGPWGSFGPEKNWHYVSTTWNDSSYIEVRLY